MFVAKQVADLITFGRAAASIALVAVGFFFGSEGLPIAAVLMLLSWMSDFVDGPLARRSRIQYHTWIGDHDLEVDMAVAGGLLAYLVLAGFVSLLAGTLYAAVWTWILWNWRGNRSISMLFQAPIYGWLIWMALKEAQPYGMLLVIWIISLVVITWPRFPREVIPGFLSGFQALGRKRKTPKQ